MPNLPDIRLNIIITQTGSDVMQGVQTAVNNIAPAVNRVVAANKNLNNSITQQGAGWTGLVDKISRIEQKYDAVWRAGFRLTGVGNQLIRVSQALSGTISDLVDQWGEYEFALNRAAGAAGIFSNQLPIYGQLSKAIQQVSIEARLFPAEEVARATYFWQSTSGEAIKTQEDLARTMAIVNTAMRVAAMTETSYEQVLKGGYSIVKQYGMNLSELPGVMKALFQTTRATALEFPDLIQAFKFVGPLAHSLGVSFESVNGILGRLGDLGIRGSQAGRGLAMAFTQIVRPTDKVKNAFNELMLKTLGVSNGFSKLVFPNGQFIGAEKYVTLLAKATAGLTQEQKLYYLATITGTQNAARVLLPLIDAEIAAMKKHTSIWVDSKYSVAGATKAFEESWSLLADSWKGVTGELTRVIEVIRLNIGERIAKILAPIVKQAAEFAKQLQGWIELHSGLVDFAVQLAGIVSVALLVVGTLFVVVGSLMGLGAGLAFVMALIGPAILGFLAFGSLVGVVFAGILKQADKFSSSMGRLFNTLQAIFLPVTNQMGGFQLSWESLANAISPIADAIANTIIDMIDRVNAILIKFKNDGTLDTIKLNIQGFFDVLNGVSSSPAISKMDGTLKGIAEGIKTLSDKFKEIASNPQVKDIITGVGDGMLKIAGGLAAVAAFAWVLKLMMGVASMLLPLGPVLKLVSVSLGLLLSPLKTVGGFFLGLGGNIAKLLVTLGLIPAGISAVGIAIGAVVAILVGGILAYITNFMGFRDKVNEVVDSIVNGTKGIGKDIRDALKPVADAFAPFHEWLSDKIPKAIDYVNKKIAEIQAIWQPAFDQISAAVGPVLQNISSTITNAVSSIQSNLGPMFTAIKGAVTPVAEALTLLAGIIGGLVTEAFVKFSEIASPIIGAFVTLLVTVLGPAFEGLVNIITTVVNFIIQTITNFFTILTGIANAFVGLFTGNWDQFWTGINQIVTGILNQIVSFFSGFFNILGAVVDTGLKILFGIFDTIFGNKPGSIYASIKHFADDLLKFGGDVVNGFVNGVSGAIGGAVTSIQGFFGGIVDGVKRTLGIGSPSTLFATIGNNIVQGLWNGIVGLGSWLTSKLWGWIKSVIPGPVLDALGIHSPSRVMMEIGNKVVQGLALGIEQSSDAAIASMTGLTNALTRVAQHGSEQAQSVLQSLIEGKIGPTGTNVAVANEHTVNIKVEVTSPDGSVSKMQTDQLAAILQTNFVREIEHMASVA